MIKNVLKQMWYQRKQNGWILIELIIIAFFLWRAIDPIFIFNRFDNFEKGHKSERSYVIDLLYQNPDPNRQQSDEAKAKDWLSKGVQPTDTVKNILVNQGVMPKPTKLSPAKTKVRKSSK